MALILGRDYAIVRKTAWIFPTGVGDSTAVVTRTHVFIFPHDAIGGRHETTYSIGGRPPAIAISELLADPATTPQVLDDTLLKWSLQVEGPIVIHMDKIKRVRIYTGWIRRSVVLSEKESGYDFAPTSIRPRKEELPAFLEFFKEHPRVEIK